MHRPGGHGGRRHRRLVRVDRDQRALGREALDQRQTRSSSSSTGTGGRSPRADSPPTSSRSAPAGQQPACVLEPLLERVRRPPSENESGVALTMPISSGRPVERQRPAGGAQDGRAHLTTRSDSRLTVTLPALSAARATT